MENAQISLYFHGRWWSIDSWKAKSFSDLFWIIPIPFDENYDDAVRYFNDNFLDKKGIILISHSAWVLPIISICYNYPENIKKVVLLNPATSMANINTICDDIPVQLYSWTNDYWRNIYMEWDKPKKNINIIAIPGNHDFKWRDEMINKIISYELNLEP